MAKLTRKSYKRKKIAFAAVILGGVALVSSGFAAWVLSNNKENSNEGAVTVGEVKDASLEMTVTLKTKRYTLDTQDWTAQNDVNSGKFNFNPEFGDVEGKGGRVYNDSESDGKFDCENLTLRYTIVVSSTSRTAFKELKVLMNEKDSGTKISTATSETNNWIVAPSCFGKEETISASSSTDAQQKKFTGPTEKTLEGKTTYSWTLDYDLTFGWGSAFNSMNPAKYFDEDSTGKNVPLKRNNDTSEGQKSVQEILETMHTTLDNAQFILTFTAVAQ